MRLLEHIPSEVGSESKNLIGNTTCSLSSETRENCTTSSFSNVDDDLTTASSTRSSQCENYIIYLEATSDSAFAERIQDVRDKTVSKYFGIDESFLYPVHITLTSFFTIEFPDDGRNPFAFVLSGEREGSEDEPCHHRKGSMISSPSSSIGSESNCCLRLAVEERMKQALKEFFSEEFENENYDVIDLQKEAILRCENKSPKDSHALIIPWTSDALMGHEVGKRNRLELMCNKLEEDIQREFPNCSIRATRHPEKQGIVPKTQLHTTILNRKIDMKINGLPFSTSWDDDQFNYVQAEAEKILDDDYDDEIWNLSINRLVSWGNLVMASSNDPSLLFSCCQDRHDNNNLVINGEDPRSKLDDNFLGSSPEFIKDFPNSQDFLMQQHRFERVASIDQCVRVNYKRPLSQDYSYHSLSHFLVFNPIYIVRYLYSI